MKKFDSLVAEDLLSIINPSIQSTRLSSAISTCVWGRWQAERVIIRGLELVAKESEESEEKPKVEEKALWDVS
jgi:hypothetical protein